MTVNLDYKTKKFILVSLRDSIKTILSVLEENQSINDEMYQAYFDYLKNVATILFKDYLLQEYNLLQNNFKMIDSLSCDNRTKLLKVCRKLVDLGNNITENY